MKVLELIKELIELEKIHGNLPVLTERLTEILDVAPCGEDGSAIPDRENTNYIVEYFVLF